MSVRKLDVLLYHHGFDGLFGCLLRVEAEVFEVDVRSAVSRVGQIAPGAAHPLARVVRIIALVRVVGCPVFPHCLLALGAANPRLRVVRGAGFVRFVDRPAFTQGRLDDQRVAVLVAFDGVWGDDDDVYRDADAAQAAVYLPCEVEGVVGVFDDEEVDVAVAVHIASGGGSEEDDLLWMRDLDDALDDVVQGALVERRRSRLECSLPHVPSFPLSLYHKRSCRMCIYWAVLFTFAALIAPGRRRLGLDSPSFPHAPPSFPRRRESSVLRDWTLRHSRTPPPRHSREGGNLASCAIGLSVIPARPPVIPTRPPVIPAKAGI